jgi:hypothetical protein
MIIDDLAGFNQDVQFLRRMRNDIIGSEENKLDYIKSGYLKRY